MRSALRDEPVSVLNRILAILETVRESHGSTTITQLALATGIPKSTVSRLVGDLVRQRYLMRTDEGVAIGLRLFELGARASTPAGSASPRSPCWPSSSTPPASTSTSRCRRGATCSP